MLPRRPHRRRVGRAPAPHQGLAKTDTHRQAELVRLLLASAVLGDGAAPPKRGVRRPWQGLNIAELPG